MKSIWWAMVAMAMTLVACHEEPLDVAPDVSLRRFECKWYEIAKLPRLTQADCTRTTAYYRLLSDNELDVVNECRLGSPEGDLRTVAAKVKVGNLAVAAKMSIDVGGFFGDFWILEVGSEYEYAVIGHPTRDYLWILSRKPTIDAATLDGILTRTRLQKFDTSRLEYTKQ